MSATMTSPSSATQPKPQGPTVLVPQQMPGPVAEVEPQDIGRSLDGQAAFEGFQLTQPYRCLNL